MKQPLTPSRYQQAILAAVSQPGDHLVIMATAGAGKTTVLVQIASAQPVDARQLFIAFARDAAAELKRRLPVGVDTRTVHSLGRFVLAEHLRSRNLELSPPQPGKYRRLARTALKAAFGQADADTAHFLSQLATAVRLQLADPGDHAVLAGLVEEAGLFLPVPAREVDRIFALLPGVIDQGVQEAERGLVDFGDMLFVPVRKRLPVPQFDLVAIDEAQDYSPVALELTLGLAAAGARLVFVGDPRQSIFGFAGADPAAMQRITERLDATVLPLSVTYRCPRLHVELARQLAPEIESAPDARPGSVRVVSEEELPGLLSAGDLVLCRLNAPLVRLALQLTPAGVPVFVRGADLQKRLESLASQVFSAGIRDPERQLRQYLKDQLRRLSSNGTGPLALHGLRDEIDCLLSLCSGLPARPEPGQLLNRIAELFGQAPGSVILSSIHRAKGQEADRVVLLQPELLPAPYARSLTALRAEACVQFVALTRARRELVLAGSAPLPDAPPVPAGSQAAADAERERIISNWLRVLSMARAGRRHRVTERRSTIRRVSDSALDGTVDA